MSAVAPHFFWERSKVACKSRFNLLLLEYAEYFFEDLSVYHYPYLPGDALSGCTNTLSKSSFLECDSLKVQGRLKLCSRSLIFEPTDAKKPMRKYPFKGILSTGTQFKLKPEEIAEIGLTAAGYFTFVCSSYVEMKANDKVGPYVYRDANGNISDSAYSSAAVPFGSSSKGGDGERVLFAVLHSDLPALLARIEKLRHIFSLSSDGSGASDNLLLPLTEAAPHAEFDTTHLADFHEKLQLPQAVPAKRVKPLLMHPGVLMITEVRLYFQPSQVNNVGDTVQFFELAKVAQLYKRRYLLRQIGLEFILQDGSSYHFIFDSPRERDTFHAKVVSQRVVRIGDADIAAITRRWQRRELTNFEYLMCLNREADRSLNDLTQYPVFPHVIADYTSPVLDLEKPETYRDLSKPVGALNASRLEYFRERFRSMPADSVPPPFLYGTHYSTPGYVLFYLVRVAPEFMLCLQNGRFDAADRMFHSVSEMWSSCLSNPADLKELIPEFFSGNGDFLVNSEGLDLGYRHTGERLGDVELPPWARSPRDLLRKNQKALESEFVSRHLHDWIDLIFGYKQQGEAAVEADNLFYHLTYEGAIDVEGITSMRERKAYELQIQEFGQTPKQLFSAPHPARGDTNAPIALCSSGSAADSAQRGRGASDDMERVLDGGSPVKLRSVSGSSSNNSSPLTLQYKTRASERPPVADIQRLGADFRQEVAKELSAAGEQSGSSGSGTVSESNLIKASRLIVNKAQGLGIVPQMPSQQQQPGGAAGTPSSIFSKTATFLDRAFGIAFSSSQPSTPSPGPSTPVRYSSESYKKALEKEASSTPTPSLNVEKSSSGDGSGGESNDMRSTTTAVPSAYSAEREWDQLDSSVPAGPPPACSEWANGDLSTFVLVPSELLRAFEDEVVGVSLGINRKSITNSSSSSSDVTSIVSSCSKDASVKVYQLGLSTNSYSSSGRFSKIRTYADLDAPTTGCCMSRDCKEIVVSCWDNYIYVYSIPNVCNISKLAAHDDSVSCLCIDREHRLLVSGSVDCAIKVWSIKNSSVSSKPLLEFYDIDSPVTSVDIDDSATFVLIGSEDGTIVQLDVRNENLVFKTPVSPVRSRCTSVKYIPLVSSVAHHSSRGFRALKLVASSAGGALISLDSGGKLYAEGQVAGGVGVCCLQSEGRNIYGGLEDGSLRVWMVGGGKIREFFKFPAAHESPVRCLSMDEDHLVSGAADGTLRLWRVAFIAGSK